MVSCLFLLHRVPPSPLYLSYLRSVKGWYIVCKSGRNNEMGLVETSHFLISVEKRNATNGTNNGSASSSSSSRHEMQLVFVVEEAENRRAGRRSIHKTYIILEDGTVDIRFRLTIQHWYAKISYSGTWKWQRFQYLSSLSLCNLRYFQERFLFEDISLSVIAQELLLRMTIAYSLIMRLNFGWICQRLVFFARTQAWSTRNHQLNLLVLS